MLPDAISGFVLGILSLAIASSALVGLFVATVGISISEKA